MRARKRLAVPILAGLLSLSADGCAPAYMHLGDDFLSVAESYEAVPKNFSQGRYWFGEYGIVSIRTENAGGTGDREFLGSERTEERHQDKRFTFVGPGRDTVRVDTRWARHEVYFDRAIWNDNELEVQTDTLAAQIELPFDSVPWSLQVVSRRGEEEFVPGGFESKGVLEREEVTILLLPVRERADAPDEATPWALGYRFVLEGRTLGAVQTVQAGLHATKRYVWLRRDLDREMKLTLAAATAALLVHNW